MQVLRAAIAAIFLVVGCSKKEESPPTPGASATASSPVAGGSSAPASSAASESHGVAGRMRMTADFAAYPDGHEKLEGITLNDFDKLTKDKSAFRFATDGAHLEASFNLHVLPKKAFLEIKHRAATDASCGDAKSWAPIAIRLNGSDVAVAYSPAPGSAFTAAAWDVTEILASGTNALEFQQEDGCSGFELRSFSITEVHSPAATLAPKSAPAPQLARPKDTPAPPPPPPVEALSSAQPATPPPPPTQPVAVLPALPPSCQCAAATDVAGTLHPQATTYCGFAICAADKMTWVCESSGWAKTAVACTAPVPASECKDCSHAGTTCVNGTCRLTKGQKWKLTIMALGADFSRGAPSATSWDPIVWLRKTKTEKWFPTVRLPVSTQVRAYGAPVVYYLKPTETPWLGITSEDLLEPQGLDLWIQTADKQVNRARYGMGHAGIVASPLLFSGGLKFSTGEPYFPTIIVKLTPM